MTEDMIDLKVPIKVIEVESLELSGKDIVKIKIYEDFVYLCDGMSTVFKLSNSYYLIGDIVAYVYSDEVKI